MGNKITCRDPAESGRGKVGGKQCVVHRRHSRWSTLAQAEEMLLMRISMLSSSHWKTTRTRYPVGTRSAGVETFIWRSIGGRDVASEAGVWTAEVRGCPSLRADGNKESGLKG